LPGVDTAAGEPVERGKDAVGTREKLVAPSGIGVGNEKE
jgi:hypothetical protein